MKRSNFIKGLNMNVEFIEKWTPYSINSNATIEEKEDFVSEFFNEAYTQALSYDEDNIEDTHSETEDWLYREQLNFYDI